MKIKNIKIKSKNKLIQLQILKSKLYKKKLFEKYSKKLEIDIYKLYFKKIANIIYEYHINNKKILFLNFPKNIEKIIISIIFQTKHRCISSENWYNGLLTNQKLNIKKNQLPFTINKLNTTSNIKLKNIFDLIILFSSNLSNVNKLYAMQIPTILITNSLNKLNNLSSYRMPGNFKFIEKQIVNNLFLCVLKSIFKQAKIKRSSIFFSKLKFRLLKKKENFIELLKNVLNKFY